MQTKNNATILLSFKYTTSKGRNTYGYNIVTLYANGKRVARTCGGGYDMRGTCLGEYIQNNYLERLKTLRANYGSLDDDTGYYGLSFWKQGNKSTRIENLKSYEDGSIISLDGACGERSMQTIAEAIGLSLQQVEILPDEWGYILTDNRNIVA
jgi:hypothetical protein